MFTNPSVSTCATGMHITSEIVDRLFTVGVFVDVKDDNTKGFKIMLDYNANRDDSSY